MLPSMEEWGMKESPRSCRQKCVVAALEAAAAVQQPAPHHRDKKNREEEARDKKKGKLERSHYKSHSLEIRHLNSGN